MPMKRIQSTLLQKWPEYLIESIVIIGSIFGAFALDSWNEGRKEKQKEKDYVVRFIQDLKRDTANFSIELSNAKRKYEKGKAAYQFIVDKNFRIEDTTAFLISLQDLGRTNKPRIYKNTYDDLVSTGNSALIANKDVLDEILTYYSTIPTEWFDKEYLDRMWKGYLPNAIHALDLDFLEVILNKDTLAIDVSAINYDLKVSESRAAKMLTRFQNNQDIEFETKNVTRTHLVQRLYLGQMKSRAEHLIITLNAYMKEL